jgi:hypothetical protein
VSEADGERTHIDGAVGLREGVSKKYCDRLETIAEAAG